jgi:hypothetical protein
MPHIGGSGTTPRQHHLAGRYPLARLSVVLPWTDTVGELSLRVTHLGSATGMLSAMTS